MYEFIFDVNDSGPEKIGSANARTRNLQLCWVKAKTLLDSVPLD